jgi:uncharacterized membrane protein YfcA
MDLWVIAALLALGLVSSVFGSIVGLGGGVIIVPTLLLAGPWLTGAPIASPTAVGTSLAVLIFTALSSTVAYAKQGKVDWRSGWLFFIGSGPAAMAGAQWTNALPEGPFQLAFGVFMLVMFALMTARDRMRPLQIRWPIRREFRDGAGQTHVYGYSVGSALPIGIAVGLVSGLFGIGGGSLFVPLMVLLYRFPPHVATATSMFVILLSSLLGSGVNLLNGNIEGWLLLALAPGAVIGGRLGAWIAARLTGKQLMWLLRFTLLLMAGYLIARGIRML